MGFFFALMIVFIALTFGKVFYLGPSALPWFFVCLFFLGFGGANFAVYTLWLPEQYPTECRASAFAFSTSFARFGGAAITFLVGSGVQRYGSLGVPVAITSLAFAVGLLLIPFGAKRVDKFCQPNAKCRPVRHEGKKQNLATMTARKIQIGKGLSRAHADSSPSSKSNARHAVLAGFLGWTLDAFDFFVVSSCMTILAISSAYPRRDIILTTLATLAMRPVGA